MTDTNADAYESVEETPIIERFNFLGASEIGIVAGLCKSSYKSRGSILLSKKYRTSRDSKTSWQAKVGLRMEPEIIESLRERYERVLTGDEIAAWAKQSGWRCHRTRTSDGWQWTIFPDARRPFLGCSPDAIAIDHEGYYWLIEVKCVMNYATKAKFGEPGTFDIPANYQCQVQAACALLGLKYAHIPVLFVDDGELRDYSYESGVNQHEYIPRLMLDVATASWHAYVVGDELPPADGKDPGLTRFYHMQMGTPTDDKPVEVMRKSQEGLELAQTLQELCDQYDAAKTAIDGWQERKKEAERELEEAKQRVLGLLSSAKTLLVETDDGAIRRITRTSNNQLRIGAPKALKASNEETS